MKLNFVKEIERSALQDSWRDFWFGLRQLKKSWPSAMLSIATLAIGIGCVAAVFGALDVVILRPLPFPQPRRLVSVWSTRDGHRDAVTPLNFDSWMRDGRSFASLAGEQDATVTLSTGSIPREVNCGEVTSSFFSVFGVAPILGRSFLPQEDSAPRQHVAILSEKLWRAAFHSDPEVIGRQVQIDRESYTVVGVMPRSLDLRPDGEQLWLPLALTAQSMNWQGGVLYVYGRLREGIALSRARAEMDLEAKLLAERFPDMNRDRGIEVESYASDLLGAYGRQLWILFAAVSLVFLIACANSANLLLAQAIGRMREMKIRTALGASRSRIVRQLLTESMIIGLLSAGTGLLVAMGGIYILRHIGADSVPRIAELKVDFSLLALLLLLALGCALLCGSGAALHAATFGQDGRLADGNRTSLGRQQGRIRNAYIAFEVGLSAVLLIGAGLLIRTAITAANVPLGFNPTSVITGRTALPPRIYSTASRIVVTYDKILDVLGSEPGVRIAAASSKVPMARSNIGLLLGRNSISPPLSSDLSTEVQFISPRYFQAMGVPLLEGRTFSTDDRSDTRQVAVINRTLARRLWLGKTAVGEEIRIPELEGASSTWSIVGVVADSHDDGLMVPAPSILYIPIAQLTIHPWQWSAQSLYLIARTQGPSFENSVVISKALESVDPGLPLGDALSMGERISQSIATAHFYTLILSGLGICGLLMTAMGIYGVVAFFVSKRKSEIGVRLALGATRTNIFGLVVLRGMRPVLFGMCAGVGLALILSRVLTSQLFGISAMDPITLCVTIGVLLVVALLACVLPASRASQIEPTVALRAE